MTKHRIARLVATVTTAMPMAVAAVVLTAPAAHAGYIDYFCSKFVVETDVRVTGRDCGAGWGKDPDSPEQLLLRTSGGDAVPFLECDRSRWNYQDDTVTGFGCRIARTS
ncbi:hypothetical protein [Streptomyces sp. 8K308]|uniref:hypothetical protein n=1 Tax=Streptomyces sp. 8K308 TaxID=2530388 RepID=UPI001404B64B|nr:hypothetical protein [Streptomyces sp. 8K308]